MEASEPQRRGWLSWFRQSVWAPSQPEPVSATREGESAGTFFPFLKSSKLPQEARQRPQPQPTNDSSRGPAAAEKLHMREGDRKGAVAEKMSARGVAADEEERWLERDLPLVWTFLREEEGWSFVDKQSGSTDVRGPTATAAGVDGGNGGVAQQEEAGPMSQGQLPSYMRNNAALLRRYRRWLESSSSPMPPSKERFGDESSGENGVVASGSNRGAGGGAMADGEAVVARAAALPPRMVSAHADDGSRRGGRDEQQPQQPSGREPALSSGDVRTGHQDGEKRLSRDLPLIWTFMREKEGWGYANGHSWHVCGPDATAGAGIGKQSARPIPQGRLPRYLLDNPELLEKYKRWLAEVSKSSQPPREEAEEEEEEEEESDRGCVDNDTPGSHAAESGRPPSPPAFLGAVASEMAAVGSAAFSAATQAPRVPAHDVAPSGSQQQGGRETPEQSQPSRETSASANDS
ncbi:unnamed protein product, partial [Ectocarpus sp. 13 AM-2016]